MQAGRGTSATTRLERLGRRAAWVALASGIALLATCTPVGRPTGPTAADSLPQTDALSQARLGPIRVHIKATWAELRRSHRDLAVAARDPKVEHAPGEPWPVFFPPSEDRSQLEATVVEAMAPVARKQIELLPLSPSAGPGLLYLPKPYVVPGGRFNEMYGWDSYFIVLGLLRDGQVQLARDMTDNHIYQVRNYGRVLNANRTYYLTRSQPPFLTGMVLAVHRAAPDLDWLQKAYDAVVAYHRMWTVEPHVVPPFPLSRYFDLGAGPAPEVVSGEKDAAGRTHYERVRAYYRTHAVPDYPLEQFYDRASDRLTDQFYKGDRSMRESGFDTSNRFGPFGADVVHYFPTCLNALLFRMEVEASEIAALLGREGDVATFLALAAKRREAVDALLWDEESGLYLDYHFGRSQRRSYPFTTTYYPLWAGMASAHQAKRTRDNLARFERAGGLMASTFETGNQWDAPFGWAPLHLLAVEGLRRYGFRDDADRIARAFLMLVLDDFEKRGAIVEKYDVVKRTSETGGSVRFGYGTNEAGFGWTNAVFLELVAKLGS